MTNNNLAEDYARPIQECSLIPGYVERMQNSMYDQKRTEETFRALEKAGIKI